MPTSWPQRPGGQVVWAHAAHAAKLRPLVHLGARLRAQRDDVSILITMPPEATTPECVGAHSIFCTVPMESVGDVDAFLNHWSPDLCIWTYGKLRPVLIGRSARRRIPLYLVDAEEKGFEDLRHRWFPDGARAALSDFTRVMTCSANVAQRLRRLGVQEAALSVTGRLQEGGAPPPFSLHEREDLAKVLAGRSLWLAAGVQPDEIDTILQAHHLASRTAHRLLLILAPDCGEDISVLETRLQDDGWRVAHWAQGSLPNETTQILLADSCDDLGLWYRIAPITFVAGSLTPRHSGRDPYEAAALGSAVLYGPYIDSHADPYRRLTEAGGARQVRDAETLAHAVTRLIAPDQAASMALAGWEVASSGAEVTDRLLDLVNDALDLRRAG